MHKTDNRSIGINANFTKYSCTILMRYFVGVLVSYLWIPVTAAGTGETHL